ncbi:WhiB family transcriptional regulator [Nocardia sp. NPDC050799]|uniref:WhiB family transcriptional regulator n=1 Tax=Nocardia sp. NPDC050799 TaxID=3154842 RepID=UPI0033EA09DE
MTRRPGAGFPSIVELAAALTDTRLTGAECVGLARLFDPRGQSEPDAAFTYRTDTAGKVCARCPVQGECATVAGELGAAAVGIWAGEIRSAPAPVGRPRKEGAA